MNKNVDILGINVSGLNTEGAADAIENMIEEGGFHSVFTPNSEIIMAAYKNPEFAKLLGKASLLTADGIGVVYASRILGDPIAERASGYDISLKLLERGAEKGYTFYLLGAAPGVAAAAKSKIEEKFTGIKITGVHDGYFDDKEEINIINDINEKAPDVIFVCLGSPKQEKWINEAAEKINVKVAMGLGGCLDVYAGNVKRAPDIFIKFGLEWLYRLIKEPSRFFRMLALPKFMFTVIGVKLKSAGGRK